MKPDLKGRPLAWWKERIGKEVLCVSSFSMLSPLMFVVCEVRGRNVRLGHDWKWIPDLFAADINQETP